MKETEVSSVYTPALKIPAIKEFRRTEMDSYERRALQEERAKLESQLEQVKQALGWLQTTFFLQQGLGAKAATAEADSPPQSIFAAKAIRRHR
jgi:hypothetical protein